MSVQEDRRDASGQRIPFEAIVEIGGQEQAGGAFEASSIDLSSGGMHLRTAYLPELGQPLVCRFDGGGQEIAAEGSVVWREEGARGGEFGVRFTNVDGPSATALLDMCGVRAPSDEPAPEPKRGEADRGTRVRLHIEGLGSPMKARVRDAGSGEVMVGSNLEFLRVGRALELEDVDHGRKRCAHIERVEVEVDAVSRVPQLVVALRYDDEPRVAVTHVAETTPDPVTVDPEPARDERPPTTMRTRSSAEAADDPMNDDEIEAANSMKSGLSRAALRVGPALEGLGKRAKTTLALLMSRAQAAKARPEATPDAPRRTTAPAPGGALHAEGKRVVRDEDDGMFEQPPKKKITRARALALGGTAGVALVLAAVAFRKPAAPPPGAEETAAATTAAAPAEANAAPVAPIAPDTVQANVPLFGPTPLSTTEAAALAPPGSPFAGATPLVPGAAQAPGVAGPTPTAAEGATPPAEQASSDDSDDEDKPSGGSSDKKASSHKDGAKVASFIHGKVVHPTVLRLPMDGAISAIHGARSATGFSVTLPGRHATASAAGLAGKDPRVASVKVVNGAKGAEVTFQFKDGVPAYAVRAKGSSLQIALGHGDKDAKDHDTKHAPSAKKGAGKHVGHKAKKD